jgi:hypothetical protein
MTPRLKVMAFVMLAACSSAQVTTQRPSPRVDSSGGGAPVALPGPSSAGLTIVSYPGQAQVLTAAAITFLNEPAAKERDGVYLWRDEQNLWHIQAVGRSFSEATVHLRPVDGTLSHLLGTWKPSSAAGYQSELRLPALLSKPESSTFHFAGSAIDVLIDLDSRQDASRVFIGADRVSPESLPFRLYFMPEGNPIPFIEVRPKAGSASSATTTPPSATVSGGRGSGGGPGVKKF